MLFDLFGEPITGMIEIRDKRQDFFLSLGTAIFLAGLCVLGLSVYVSVFLMIFSIGFFFGKIGIEIDPKGDTYRRFWSCWFTKFGKWKRFQTDDSLNLSLSANNSHMKMGGMENILIASSKSIYYVLSVRNDFGKKEILKFRSYRRARMAMNALSQNFHLEFLDEIAKKLLENRSRKRSR